MKSKCSLLIYIFTLSFPFFLTAQVLAKQPDTIPIVQSSRKWMQLATAIIAFEHDPSLPRVARFYAYVASVYADTLEKTGDETQANLATSGMIRFFYPQHDGKITQFFDGLDLTTTILSPSASEILRSYRQRSQADGFREPWDNNVPVGIHTWYRRKGEVDSPRAGTWQYWIITDTSDIKTPPPPEAGSLQDIYEIERIRYETDIPTRNDGILSEDWQNILYAEKKNLDDPSYAQAQKILSQTVADALISCWKIKFMYWSERPSMRIPNLHLSAEDPESPSYPSAEAVVNEAAASALAYLFPDKTTIWTAASDRSIKTDITEGTQWEIDSAEGTRLGAQIARAVIRKLHATGNPAPEKILKDNPQKHGNLAIAVITLKSINWLNSFKRSVQKIITNTDTGNTQTNTPSKYPESGEYMKFLELGKVYESRQQYDEAETALRKAISLSPHNVENTGPYFRLMQILSTQGRHGEQEQILKDLIALDPNPDLYIDLSRLYSLLRRYPDVEQILNSGLTIYPRSAKLYRELINFYLNGAQHAQKASAVIKRAQQFAIPDPVSREQ